MIINKFKSHRCIPSGFCMAFIQKYTLKREVVIISEEKFTEKLSIQILQQQIFETKTKR